MYNPQDFRSFQIRSFILILFKVKKPKDTKNQKLKRVPFRLKFSLTVKRFSLTVKSFSLIVKTFHHLTK